MAPMLRVLMKYLMLLKIHKIFLVLNNNEKAEVLQIDKFPPKSNIHRNPDDIWCF